MDKLNQALEDVEKETKMNTKPNEVLIFKDQFPFCVASSVLEASKITLVPPTTIRAMISKEPVKIKDVKNGGRTSPDGWGFDYLA
jgi:hypothetical protein